MAKKAVSTVEKQIKDKDIQKEFGRVISTGLELLNIKKERKAISVSPSLDLALNGGILEGCWTLIAGEPKSGKEQPIYSTIYTEDGPIAMGDVEVGMRVLTPDGGSSKIKKIHENGVKDVYRITFSDNTYVDCGLDHLWTVEMNCHGMKNKPKTITLREIISSGIRYCDRPKYKIGVTNPVMFSCRDVPIDPYILGCLLGDGSLTEHSVRITNTDAEILDSFRDYCKSIGMEFNKVGNSKYSYSITNRSCRNPVSKKIKELGLYGKNSHTKFIPDLYKINSKEVRLELIRGLMDTDGSATKFCASYTTTSISLANDFMFVVRSLGYLCVISTRYTKCNGKTFKSYRIHIKGNNLSDLFKIKRKKCTKNRTKCKIFKTITSITKIGMENCRCIEIENEDGLYLTDDFTITHNSTTCLQICANAQSIGKPVIYLDVEDKLEGYNLEGIEGLDINNMTVIHPPREEGESLSAEDFLNIASSLIKKPEYKGAVLVIDSCSDLLPRSEMDADTSGSLRATLPKMLTHWIKKTSQDIAKSKVLVLVIQHYITNTSGYGKLKNPDGGQELQYKAATRMDIYKTEPWIESDKKIGQIVYWKISCSSMGASGTECVSFLRFGKGIDKEKEIIELAESFGIIEKAGAWYSIPFLAGTDGFEEAPKFQGQAKIYDFLVDRKDIFDSINAKVKEMLEELNA